MSTPTIFTLKRYLNLVMRGLSALGRGEFKRVARAFRYYFQTIRRRFSKPEYFRPNLPAYLLATDDLHDDDPLVSVIIPCFNYGRFVGQAIESVLAQTLVDTEIIVVEGGSTDAETVDIVRALNYPRTRILYQERGQLVGANRNFGISVARGRYICCLDADDTIEPTYLEKAVYLLENYRYDVVSTGINLVGARQGEIDVLEFPTLRDMTIGNHIPTCAVFKKKLWQAVGGFHDTGKGGDHVPEDWDFWLRIAATGARLRNIVGEHLFNYRIHAGGSLSSAPDVMKPSAQRLAILERSRQLLSPAAFKTSAGQARRRLVSRVPGATLTARQSRRQEVRRSVLIAVPYLIVGGAERLLASVTRQLVAKGWHVTVISTLYQVGHESTASWFTAHCNEVYMLRQFLSDPAECDDFIRYLLASRKFDAMLLAGSTMIYNLLPEIARTFPELAVVDLLFNTQGHAHSHALHQADITLAIGENPEVMAYYHTQNWPSNRVRMIESGIDVSRFSAERPKMLAAELRIKDEQIVIGFSGRLSEEKAPEVFLQIAAALRDEPLARFVMTGAGPLLDNIKSQLASLPAGTNIEFLGHVDSTLDYFALYDIFVLPSRLDGRPVALLEALASGCAIMASRVGGIPALIGEGGCGVLCRPADPLEFAENIRKLVKAPARLAAMKQNALDTARQLLSESQMGDNYIEALEAAIMVKRQAQKVALAGQATDA